MPRLSDDEIREMESLASQKTHLDAIAIERRAVLVLAADLLEARAAARNLLDQSPVFLKNDNARCTVGQCFVAYWSRHHARDFPHRDDCPWAVLRAAAEVSDARG